MRNNFGNPRKTAKHDKLVKKIKKKNKKKVKNKRKFATNFLGANRARKCAKSTTRHQSQSVGEEGRKRSTKRGGVRASRQTNPAVSFLCTYSIKIKIKINKQKCCNKSRLETKRPTQLGFQRETEWEDGQIRGRNIERGRRTESFQPIVMRRIIGGTFWCLISKYYW